MKDLLKILVCGSVDDGKSTLIGHLLYNCNCIYLDQKDNLIQESKKSQEELDYSLLLDGLNDERKQKITIDVAYRYFNTNKRSFIIADAPGHEEYTRNMAVGASNSQVAVILIDVTNPLLSQTKRHLHICHMFGIKDFIFVVNKMDLVNYKKQEFLKVQNLLITYLKKLDISSYNIIPISAKAGENLNKPSSKMPWYKKDDFLTTLEKIDVNTKSLFQDFCFNVQRVSRPNSNFRGYQGPVISGQVKIGDELLSLPSHQKVKIIKLYAPDKQVEQASKDMQITLQLDREIDLSRGDLLVKKDTFIYGNMFSCDLLWTDDEALNLNQTYLLKINTKIVNVTITNINYLYDINTNTKKSVSTIDKNAIFNCDILLQEKIVCDLFSKNQNLGRFILINPLSNQTSAAGIIKSQLNSKYIYAQNLTIDRSKRSEIKNQKPVTFWLTGLSASGKSTIANELEKYLVTLKKHTMLLDGDNIRLGLNQDLGFSLNDRAENLRRVSEVAKLLNDAGLICITSFISPLQKNREQARKIIGDNFVEIYIKTPLDVCIKRDTKHIYDKARQGIIKDFTGISSPFEKPTNPEIIVDNTKPLPEVMNDLITKIEKYL